VGLRHNTIDVRDIFDGNAAWQSAGTYTTAENN